MLDEIEIEIKTETEIEDEKESECFEDTKVNIDEIPAPVYRQTGSRE